MNRHIPWARFTF